MNNNTHPTLRLIQDLIQSHLELLQQQHPSSPNPHISLLLQSQFHDHLNQTLLSIQSYTSQQTAILQLIQPQPLPPSLSTFTSQHHPPTHTPQPPYPTAPQYHPPTHNPQPPYPTAPLPIKFYAVRRGRTPNTIYTTWEECKSQVHQFSGAEFKSFRTYREAQAYLSPTVSPSTDLLPT
jgi:hypothetical protein